MKAVTKEERRVAYPLVLIFGILSLGIVVGGTFYYRNYERQFRAGIEQQLSAIAELKADELVQYRKERLENAGIFLNNYGFSVLVKRFLTNPEDGDAQRQIQEWADKFMATDQYDHVRLLDVQGVTRLSSPVGLPQVTFVTQRIPQVLESDQVTFRDIHLNENDRRAYLNIMVPIFEEQNVSRPLGVFYLRIDPEKHLYPLIQRWPTPSRTAESLLLRREGNDALYLNNLRYRTNAALNLRISLEQTNVPAVRAALGQTGIMQGMDYRGVPVIAAVRAVNDSPWFLVAKIDTAEVYVPLRERLRLTVLLTSLLLIGTGLGIGIFWRHQRVRFYKERYQMAEALRESEERFGRVFEEGPTGMAMLDETLRFIQVNPAFASMLGYSEQEMRTMAFTDITHPDHVQKDVEQVRRLLRGELSVYSIEKRYVARSGKELWGLVQVSVVRNAAGAFRYFLAIISDINERKRAEMARRESEERLRSHTDNSPMAVVEWNAGLIITQWTGAAEKMFGWSAEEAIGKPITELPKVYEADLPAVQGVIRQLADGVSKHVFSSNRNRTRNGQVIHCEWYSSVLHDAGGKMISVLSQVLDITERKRAEEALRSSENRLNTLLQTIPDLVWLKDVNGVFLFCNATFERLFGARESAIIGKTDYDFVEKSLADFFRQRDQAAMAANEPTINEEWLTFAQDGYRGLFQTIKTPMRDAGGALVGILGVARDITERKRAEEALRESQALHHSLVEQMPAGVFRKDREDRYVLVNDWFCQLRGMKAEEILGKTPEELIAVESAKHGGTRPEITRLLTEGTKHHERIMRSGERIEVEEEYPARDGRKRYLRVVKSPVFDPDGKIVGTQGVLFEITEIKRAEAALRESQALYYSLVEQLPVGVFRKDSAGRYVLVNRWFLQLRNMQAEDYLGKTSSEVADSIAAKRDPTGLTIKYAAAGDDHHKQIMQTGKPVELVESCVDADGRKRFMHAMKFPVFDSAGKIIGTQGLLFDITDRKKAEDELRRSNEALARTHRLLKAMLDNIPDRIYFKDAQSRFLMVSQSWASRFNLADPEDVVGKTDFDFQVPERAREFHADEQRIMQTGEALINKTEKQIAPGGEVGWTSTTKVPMRDQEGKVIGLVGINRDITEIKQAAEALHHEQTLMATLMETLPDPVYFKDAASRFLRVNPAMARRFGLSDPAQLVGKTDEDFFTGEHAGKALADEQEILRTGQPLVNIEEKETWPDGSETWVLTTKLPLRDDAGRIIGTCGISSNITGRKRAEETLRRNEERLLKVVTQTRCILNSGQVEGPADWRERALNPESPFHWDFPVQNEETAQKILPLELAPGEKYQQAWTRSRNHADHTQMNWNSGNAFLNDLPFYRNEFRCIDKHGVGHWMQQFVTVRKLAENRWEIFGITTDISDLKRVEVELRESQALYYSLVDQMPAGVFRKDAEGRYAFVNPTFCRFKEMTPEQFLGKTALDLEVTDAELKTKGADHHAMIMQSGKPIEVDEVYTRADGQTRNYHVVKSPVLNSAGEIVGTQGILFDITERKRAEQGLEQAFQRQRGISWLHENLLAFQPLRDKLQLVTETIVRLFDADFCRIWLARPGDLCEQGCMHASVAEGPHACRHREMCLHLMASAGRYTHLDGAKHRRVPFGAYKIGRIAAGEEPKFLINDVQQNPQVHDREWAKELGLVSFAGYRLQSPGGAPLGVLGLFAKRPLTAQEDVLLEALSNAATSVLLTQLAEDQTQLELIERKRAEEALRWSETQLHVILESTADGILAVDSKGKVIEANRRFAELWRIPQSLMDARDDRVLLDFVLKQLSDPDAFLKKVQSLYGTDALDMDTLAFKDGRVFERYSFPMMMDGMVIGRVWSFRDITGRKRQEKELNEKNSELERFTYTVSHDLKSPLVTVKTFLGYLEQDLTGLDKERVKQDVAYMHTAADKMGLLLDELLNLARVGRKMNPAERVTFKELAQEAVRLVAGRISTGGAEVQVADAAVVLEGDRPRLMEIWQNLVENACKFMGNQPKPRVEIGVEQRGSETVFFVRDNGAGIDPRYQEKVFGLFEKLDPKGEGTGMGLTLVKRIVEMYKGRIWVESPGLGQGANFLFTLPGAVIIDPEQSS